MDAPPVPKLSALVLSDANVHTFADALQVVVAAQVGSSPPSPSPIAPLVRVATLSLLHLCFKCGLTGYAELPPIWEEVARMKGRIEGLATLNQTLLRGIPSCWRIFGGRAHFRTSIPLLAFVKNVTLMKPSLDP